MSDTPVGRATKASQWRYPYPPDPIDEQRVTVVVSRLGFKEGAAWSRTDALHDLTDTEIDLLAEAMHDGTRPPDTKPWAELSEKTRSRWRTDAHTYLSSFLTGRRAEG